MQEDNQKEAHLFLANTNKRNYLFPKKEESGYVKMNRFLCEEEMSKVKVDYVIKKKGDDSHEPLAPSHHD